MEIIIKIQILHGIRITKFLEHTVLIFFFRKIFINISVLCWLAFILHIYICKYDCAMREI